MKKGVKVERSKKGFKPFINLNISIQLKAITNILFNPII
jgi:hypothetical protein